MSQARPGFFIPYRYVDSVAPSGMRPSYAAIENLFRAHESDFRGLLKDLRSFENDLGTIKLDSPPPLPRWGQDWFPRLDAAIAYGLVRLRQPRQLIEVGSGHSTRFLAAAIRDHSLKTRHCVIDPAPRAAITGLPIDHVAATLPGAGLAPFAQLQAGDMLFIDSSHILMPGSDVDFLLNHVISGLPAGVLLHFHDVFLPDDYPESWAWRGYNEQTALPSLILGQSFRLLWASHYVASRLPEMIERSVVGSVPLMPGAYESSLWLEKTV